MDTFLVLAAEVVHSYLPRIVELHNYSAANSVTQKEYNWTTLNDKVFRRFGFHLTSDDIEQIVRARPGVIERTLLNMRTKLENAKLGKGNSGRSGASKSAGSKRQTREPVTDARGMGNDRQRGNDRQSAAPLREQRQQPVRRQQPQQQQQQFQQQQQQPQQNNYNEPTSYNNGNNNNNGSMYPQTMQKEVDQEMLEEKEQEVQELRETIDILELKVKKLEQLVRLKDSKIQALTSKMNGGM